MDLDTRRVTLDGKYLRLTPLEFQLLHYFMQHPGDLLTKEDLLENVWGYLKPGGNMNLVETTIRRLRMKIEIEPSNPRYIQTVWGRGYRLGSWNQLSRKWGGNVVAERIYQEPLGGWGHTVKTISVRNL